MLNAALFAAGLSLWPEVDYDLRLRLDATEHVVAGTAIVSFTNTSDKALTELWFHLYMNAFQDGATLFMRRVPGEPTGSRSGRLLRRPGAIDIRSLTWAEHSSDNLWALADPHSPGDPNDKTDIRLSLPSPIPPGARTTLTIDFETTLPELVERSGYEGDFHLVSGFYPKLARLSPQGEFDHFAYHPLAEFSANFGTYRVELDVPLSHKVGTTGEIRSRRVTPHRAHYQSVAERVHDFAWTSWSGFSEETRAIGRTAVTLLTPQRDAGLAKRYFDILGPLLADYGEFFGSYPHATLTVVHPPYDAAPAGGMEYPRLITTGGIGWLGSLGIHYLELITAHELAHQWFQGIVASNEYEAPWLDESLTTLAESRFLEKRFGTGGLISTPFLTISESSGWRVRGLETRIKSALLSAPEYGSFETLARTIYARAPLALETIRRVYGKIVFDQAMRDYATTFRFGHPNSADFFNVFEAHLGQEATLGLKALLAGQKSGYRLAESKTTRLGEGRFQTETRVVPEGSVVLPLRLDARLSDGQIKSFPVRGETTIRFQHTAPLESLCIDPDELIVIDENRINNRFRPRSRTTQVGQKTLVASLLGLFLSFLFG